MNQDLKQFVILFVILIILYFLFFNKSEHLSEVERQLMGMGPGRMPGSPMDFDKMLDYNIKRAYNTIDEFNTLQSKVTDIHNKIVEINNGNVTVDENVLKSLNKELLDKQIALNQVVTNIKADIKTANDYIKTFQKVINVMRKVIKIEDHIQNVVFY